jgi:hypothetical protein
VARKFEWTDALDAALLAIVERGDSYAAAGRELGCSAFSARHRACKLGVAEQRRFEWRDEHEMELLKWLSKGETLINIAKKLGISIRALRMRASELGIKPTAVSTIYALDSIPRRFIKVHLGRIAKWVEYGWLPKPTRIKTQTPGRYFYRYTREQLEAFLEVEDAWLSWEPDNLVEKDLREYARERRANAGWRWMPGPEVAAYLGYAHGGNNIIRRWAANYIEWNGTLWIKSSELPRMEQAIQNNRWHRGTLGHKYRESTKNVTAALALSQIEFLEQRYGNAADGIRAVIDAAMAESAQRGAAD